MRLLARLIADDLDDRARGTEQARAHSGDSAVGALLAALAARDTYTGSHWLDVVELARKVAHQLRLPREQVADIEQVALLHDLGKIGIPDTILQKPGRMAGHAPALRDRRSDHRINRKHQSPRASDPRRTRTVWWTRLPGRNRGRRDSLRQPDRVRLRRIPRDGQRPPIPPSDVAADAQAELQANAGSQFDPEVISALLRVLERLDHSAQAQTALSAE